MATYNQKLRLYVVTQKNGEDRCHEKAWILMKELSSFDMEIEQNWVKKQKTSLTLQSQTKWIKALESYELKKLGSTNLKKKNLSISESSKPIRIKVEKVKNLALKSSSE